MITVRLSHDAVTVTVALSLVMGMHARCIRCNVRLHAEALALAGHALAAAHAFRDGWISYPDLSTNSASLAGARTMLEELGRERDRAETRLDRPALYVMQAIIDHELTCAKRAHGYSDDEVRRG